MVIIGASFWAGLLNLFVIVWALLLMLIVLIQRGKGGGLSGAFGGAGGSSAFGSRSGDAFTKITLYGFALPLLLLIMIQVKVVKNDAIGSAGSAFQERSN